MSKIKKQPKLQIDSDRVIFRRHAAIFLFGIGILGVNFATPILAIRSQLGSFDFYSQLSVLLPFGTIIIEPILLSMFLGLFQQSLWSRIVLTFTFAMFLLASIWLGVVWVANAPKMESSLLGFLPIIIFSGSIPFFLAKKLFHWQILLPNDDLKPVQPLSVLDLGIATTAVAVSLSFVTLVDRNMTRLVFYVLMVPGIISLVFVPLTHMLFKHRVFWVFQIAVVAMLVLFTYLGLADRVDMLLFSVSVFGLFIQSLKISGYRLETVPAPNHPKTLETY